MTAIIGEGVTSAKLYYEIEHDYERLAAKIVKHLACFQSGTKERLGYTYDRSILKV